MKRGLVILLLFLVACVPVQPEVNTAEEVIDTIEVKEEVIEVPEEVKATVNGKTVDKRIEEAYTNLHGVGSAQHIRDNFPDIEKVYVDDPASGYPKEILPFIYYYSAEADKTFNLCAIERTVFICDGKLDSVITDDDMNSGKCRVTPVYAQVNNY
jgi:hypothetical protein